MVQVVNQLEQMWCRSHRVRRHKLEQSVFPTGVTPTRLGTPLIPLEHAIRAELRRARRLDDLTQEQVAEAAGMSAMTYRRIERGETHVDMNQLAALVAVIPSAGTLGDLVTRAERRSAVRVVIDESTSLD